MGIGAATSVRWAALAGAGLGLVTACRSPSASIMAAPEASAAPPASRGDTYGTPGARARPPASTSGGAAASASGGAAASASGGAAASGVAAASGSAAGACAIQVVGVEEAAVYTGPGPDTPARQRAMEHLSPQVRQQWRGRDHAYRHLLCRYVVSVNGKRYRHEHVAGQQLGFGRTLDTARCATEEEMRSLEADLVRTTRGCSDLHAGAYWGADLVEMTP